MSAGSTHVLSQLSPGHCGVTGSRWATVDGALHRVGHRLGFRLVTGLASSFSIGTGLAGTTTLPIFAFSRFWTCYRSLESFLSKVSPFVLEGHCSQPSPSQKEFNLPLDGAHQQVLFS